MNRILILGGTGLIGRQLNLALSEWATVTISSRHTQECPLNLEQLPKNLTQMLSQFDTIINAAGIAPAYPKQQQYRIHYDAIKTIAQAAIQAKVSRFIQISALSQAPCVDSAYLDSKYKADQYLLSLPINTCILRPSLVYAPNGISTRLFKLLAQSPIWCLPQQTGIINPIHILDVIKFIEYTVAHPELKGIFDIAGHPLTFEQYLTLLSNWPKAHISLKVSDAFIQQSLRYLKYLNPQLISQESYRLLLAGSTSEQKTIEKYLQRPPIAATDFAQYDKTL
ncbi:NAD-dependent epimerase/dehydratase family protein [Neisseria sp. Ec49-e6-T10]|uniref:NAD-dependent epimerase/dehydratase family protein n=1 Tax=Neisseria sp. Ec49-e6-T10 TaxID=3140744 RepID=UPI003EC00A11